MDNETTIRDAIETARDAVKNGFFETFEVIEDEGPYYGDVDAAIRGTIYGDDHLSAVEPWESDVEDVEDISAWEAAWRDELYRLGRIELGLDGEL